MRQFLIAALLVFVYLTVIGCQEYSAGLQQGSNRAEETSAIATLRTIATAQASYNMSNTEYGSFEQLAQGGFLDARFNRNNPQYYGYSFKMQVAPASEGKPGFYSCAADPLPNLTGRHFYIESDSHDIHVNATRAATANDEVLRP